jgi:ketosteroid isomerase-like protein
VLKHGETTTLRKITTSLTIRRNTMHARKPEEVNSLFFEAMNRGDVEAAVALHEPTARWFQQSGEIITGLPGIRAALLGFSALKPKISAEITALANGDESVALTRSTWSLVGTGADGQPVTMGAKSTEVVRRQPDGTWLFAVVAPGAD